MIEKEKLAYLAGFIDGEGSFIVSKHNNKDILYNFVLKVGNTDLKVLNWIQQNFGGKLNKRNRRYFMMLCHSCHLKYDKQK